MRITLERIKLLSNDQLNQAHAAVVVRLRRERDPDERQRLGRFWLELDGERGRRRAQRLVNARSGHPKAEEGESLAHRVVSARNSLYGDAQKEEIRRRAAKVRREIQPTWRDSSR